MNICLCVCLYVIPSLCHFVYLSVCLYIRLSALPTLVPPLFWSQTFCIRVQHVVLRATWYQGTAQILSLTELKSRLFQLYFIGWTINRWRRGGNRSTRRKPLTTSFRKCQRRVPIMTENFPYMVRTELSHWYDSAWESGVQFPAGGHWPGPPRSPDKPNPPVDSSTLRDQRKCTSRQACSGRRPAGPRGLIHLLHWWKDHHQNPHHEKMEASTSKLQPVK